MPASVPVATVGCWVINAASPWLVGIKNPRTGKSTSGVNSVAIIGPQGVDTDPLSTSVFVLGPEKGLDLINRLPGFDAVIITSQGKVLYSQGLIAPE